jgi:hypothetical protein
VGKYGVDAPGLGWGLMTHSCEHVNEPSGSIKVGSSQGFYCMESV